MQIEVTDDELSAASKLNNLFELLIKIQEIEIMMKICLISDIQQDIPLTKDY